MENKFKKGLLLGGLLGVASIVGYVVKKHGTEITDEVQGELKTLSAKVKKKLINLEDVTKDKFSDLVTKVVEDYAEKKSLASAAKTILIAALLQKWEEMEEAYKAEHKDEE